MRRRAVRNHALVHGHPRPGDPLHEVHRGVAIDVGVVPAILLDDAEHAGRRRMSRDAGRNTRMRDWATVGIERELLLADRDDNGEHTFCPGGEVLALLGLGRRLVARCQHRGFRLGRTRGVRQWRRSRLHVERNCVGGGGEPGQQGGGRRHGQQSFTIAGIDRMAPIGPLRLLHEGPPGASCRGPPDEVRTGLKGLVAPAGKRFEGGNP